MLRAITGYFFGGVVEEAPQTTVECDTREVNDWLVVNMADRPDDDIDMDDEIEVDLMSDAEYDEILDAVSCLMRTEELENEESFLDDNCSETEEIDSQTWSKSDENSSDESDDDRMSISYDDFHQYLDAQSKVANKFDCYANSYGNLEPNFYLNMFDVKFNFSPEVVQNFSVGERNIFFARSKPASVVANQNINVKFSSGTDGLQDYKKTVKVVRQSDFIVLQEALAGHYNVTRFPNRNYSMKQMVEVVKEKPHKPQTRCPEVTCHPVYSKSYVNHRNPALPHKSDLMQKIRQLEVEQTQDNKIKKFITKGQLNRQNKNYIFESSCKKNRRKNLQRNPSGANNNRKC